MAANWSQIPKELLIEITTHLNFYLDIHRLTSVCSSWRNFLLFYRGKKNPTSKFPLIFNRFTLCKRSILLLSPPSEIPSSRNFEKFDPWVVKFEGKNPNFYRLFYPLSNVRVNCDFGVVDVLNVRINELGCEYFLEFDRGFCFNVDLLREKVVLLEIFDRLFALSINVSGKLVLFDSGVNRWRLVSDLFFDVVYDDVIVFNGDFYAVDCNGRTMLVNVDYNGRDWDNNNNSVCPNDAFVNVGYEFYDNVDNDTNNPINPNDALVNVGYSNDGNDNNQGYANDVLISLDIVGKPVCGGDKKRLVEIGGELMMVDVYVGFPPFEGFWDKMDVLEDYVASKKMWFKVYRLDKEMKEWVEVKELGEYVLFLGLHSSFSVSVKGLSSLKGNCIYFTLPENFCPSHANEDEVIKYHCGGVYDMEDGSISYSNLFWPPPPWLFASS